jgi:putative hemolysin
MRHAPMAILLAVFAVAMTVALSALSAEVGDPLKPGMIVTSSIVCKQEGMDALIEANPKSEAAVKRVFMANLTEQLCLMSPTGYQVRIMTEYRHFVDFEGDHFQSWVVEIVNIGAQDFPVYTWHFLGK